MMTSTKDIRGYVCVSRSSKREIFGIHEGSGIVSEVVSEVGEGFSHTLLQV